MKWFWIKVPNIQVISEITKKYFFCHARWHLFSATCAVTVVPHMHVCVSKFKHHGPFCYFITLLIVLLIWTTLLYTSISFQVIFSEFNRSWMFSKHFLPVVITLQVLHIIFKWTCNLPEIAFQSPRYERSVMFLTTKSPYIC